ncbi:MAG: helix-turn-helix transcriptional regulator [Lachnospiraceae bacterium]|nr:helix-turn-helix transcriptional regulator [Lachnospiraceae bacterium]
MYTEQTQIEIGNRVRKIRTNKDESQQQFSEKASISANFLSEIENGKKGISCETLYNICESQEISADYILFGEEKEDKPASETIMETASGMNTKELSVTISYLDALKKMKEL